MAKQGQGRTVGVGAGQLLFSVNEAIAITGTSRTTLYKEAKAGRLRMLKIGASTRISHRAIEDWLELLERQALGKGAA